MVCREMLQQAQHDVEEARAEVQRLEKVAQREHTISTMADAAKRAKHQRQVLESAMAAANAALEFGAEVALRVPVKLPEVPTLGGARAGSSRGDPAMTALRDQIRQYPDAKGFTHLRRDIYRLA